MRRSVLRSSIVFCALRLFCDSSSSLWRVAGRDAHLYPTNSPTTLLWQW
jgi:hypothetical protein